MEKNEQDIVLEAKDRGLILSASAGSGKTSTMIKKIFNVIYENKIDISNLLVLTYTNAAAAEMKSRLNDYLINKCADSEEREFLQNQLTKLSVADISTFHSFYEKLIKANYFLLNINPSFSIAEESELKILKENAFNQTLSEFKEDEEKYLKLFSSFNKKRSERALFQRILRLQDFLGAENDEGNWLDDIALSMLENLDIPRKILKDYYDEYLKNVIEEFNKILLSAKNLDEERILSHCNLCLSDLEAILKSDISIEQEKLLNYSFPRFVCTKKDDENLANQLKSVKKRFSKFLKSVKDENLELYAKNDEKIENIKEKYQIFIEFYKKYASNLKELKNKGSIYDFSDIEKMALKLLKMPQVKNAVKEQYKYIFVDEFQDVNNLQNEILKQLCEDSYVFIVGDPKQSIYAFRQSDVSIFTDTVNRFHEEDNFKDYVLKNNYRSNKKILEFCNCVFSNIMTVKTSGIDYEQTSMFCPYADIPTKFSPVDILLCNKNVEQKEEELSLYKVFNARTKKISYNEEAVMIFNKICELLEQEIFDDKLKDFRKIKYSDITILVRSRGNLSNSLANIFEDNGVPYMLNAEKDLKKSKLVLALICAMTILTNYYSEIDYATFLNRFCALSYADMAKIKTSCQTPTFEDACKEYLNLPDGEEEIKNKIALFDEIISKLKLKVEIDGIYKTLKWLIKNSKFSQFVDEIDNVEEEKQMMQSFLNFVAASKYNDNLISLLDIINENETLKVEQNLSGGQEKINITTIHASKGLEYNIVFLAGLGKSIFKNMPNASDIKVNKNLGISLKLNEEESISLFEKAIKIQEKDLDFAESLRLLYVGMTRVKNHLFLTAQGEFDCVEKIDENNIKYVEDNYMQYILGSLNDSAIKNINNGANYSCEDYKIEFCQSNEFKNELEELSLSQEKNNEIVEKIEKIENIDFKSELSTLSQKTSVSEIMKDEDYESVSFLPNTMQINEHLKGVQSGVEIGNAFHEIMERSSLNASFEEVKSICQDVYNSYLENGISLEKDFVELSVKLCCQAIKNIKNLVAENSKIYKEKKFMICASPKEILSYGNENKVLIQGIIDFFAVGEKIVLIDYKYSLINNDGKLKEKYKNQLKIYSFALQKFLNREVDEIYLLNLRNGHIIRV